MPIENDWFSCELYMTMYFEEIHILLFIDECSIW